MTSVFVTGHRGMLGHMVARYLASQGHEILTTEHRYLGGADDALVRAVVGSGADAVVNCAGIVTGASDQMIVNGLLPSHLASAIGDRPFIQPSTDCVFNGRRGWYRVTESPNATDPYGVSKRIGEGCLGWGNVVVLRTSIVGPGERGLLGWFLRQPRAEGWADHYWNGITTLAWAKIAAAALAGRVPPGLHQPATETALTKYDLLVMFGEVFGHAVPVAPVEMGSLDRTLVPTMSVPLLHEQLLELRDWR